MKKSVFLSVARTEMRIIMRDGLFRVLGAFIVLAVCFLYFVFPRVGFRLVDGSSHFKFLLPLMFWPGQGIHSASHPNESSIISALCLSFLLAIVSSMSMRREKVLDTSQVVHSHDISNTSYIVAKGAGIFFIFSLLTVILMIPAFLRDLIDTDISLSLIDYLIYPTLISLPVFIFVLGTAFLLSTRLDARMSAFFILIPLLALALFATTGPYRSIFDLFAVRTPMLRTPVTGFGDLAGILVRRSIFLLGGISLLLASALSFDRRRQSARACLTTGLISALCMVGALSAISAEIMEESAGRDMRSRMRVLDREALDSPMITVEAYSIDLDHRGDMIGCRTEMAIENETAVALDRYLFTLNPGLEVVSAECSSGPCSFERDLHHLWIILPGPISPGSKDTVEVVYSGEIEDDACYLFLTDFERWRPVDSNFGRDITSPAGRFAIIDEDNLVLLPEIQWYPLPGVQYDPDRPDRCPAAFHSFELSYSGMKGLVPVSQGRRNDMETGRILFTPSHPMIGISVIAGDYRVRSMAVDGTTYSSYTYKAYDRLDDFLPAPQDTLPAMIRELRDEYDTDAFFPYPYDRFSAVELPAHLRYHANRLWPGTGPWIQPEMMLSGRESRSHEVRLKRQSRHLESGYVGRSEPLTEKEIKARLLRLQMATFGNLAYYGTYNSHRVRLVSDELPTISKAFDVYNQFHGYARGLGYNLARSIDGRDMPDRLDPMTMTSRALRGRSLQELVASQADPDSTYMAVMAKGMCLFEELEARIGEKEFLKTLEALIDAHPFSSITLAGLAGEVDRRFGVDILPFVEEWYSSSDLPCFIFTDIELVQAIVGDHPLYNLRLKVSNPSKRDGAFVLSGADPRESIERPFLVEAGTTKEIGMIFHRKPNRCYICTLISDNIPNSPTKALTGEIEQIDAAALLDGERRIRTMKEEEEPSIIVDNEDEGFAVNNAESESLFDFLPWRKRKGPTDGYMPLKITKKSRWTPCVDIALYGGSIRSACCISAGEGKNTVSWTARLPEQGLYDLYVYLPKPWPVLREKFGKIYYGRSYNFTVFHGEGESEESVGWLEAEEGWTIIGRYYFDQGPARVQLSDRSTDGLLIADAVKWVRR